MRKKLPWLSVALVLWVGCVIGCDEDSTERGDAGAAADAGGDGQAGADAALGPDAAEAGARDADVSDASTDAELADMADAAPPPICMSVAPTSCPDPAPTYADVAPIFAERCVTCHNGSDGEWPLSSYQHVADWYGEIRAMMLSCAMPPPDSGMTMELEERQLILTWIRCDLPR